MEPCLPFWEPGQKGDHFIKDPVIPNLPNKWLSVGLNLIYFTKIYPMLVKINKVRGFSGGSGGKESACNAGDPGLIPESGRSPGEGNGNPLQYSYLENSTDRKPGRLPSTGSQELETTEQLIKQQHPILTTFPPVICFNFSSSCTSWEQRAWYFSPFVALCSTVSRLNQW